MLSLESKNIRFLSMMGARGVLGQAVFDLLRDGKKIYVVTADLSHASGFDRVQRDFPERLINVGIAEQNLIGVAAGLARNNTPVFATTWAMFASARVADQVRNYMGFMQSNIKLIGMDSGFVQSQFSYSHTNPPDIAIMRSIPGLTILSPCDGSEIYRAIYEAVEINGPVYIRLSGGNMLPIIYKDFNYEYRIGVSNVLREGSDVAIIATGNTVKCALAIAEILPDCISCKVIDMHTIKPLDLGILAKLRDFKLIVSIEDHLISGGLGSAISEYYADGNKRPRHIIVGVDDIFTSSGNMEYVQTSLGIEKNVIAKRIMDNLMI